MIGLSHNLDTFRVQLVISDRPDGTVLVERSTNELFWQTVRGGVELPLESGGSLSDWEYRDKKLNFYRVTPVDPPAGLLLDGTAGGYASTPDTAALDITGDIDLRADVALNDWSPAVIAGLINKYDATGDQRAYRLVVLTDGTVQIRWSTDGTAVNSIGVASTTTPAAAGVISQGGDRLAVRAVLDVNNGAGQYAVTFYTSPTMAGGWTQLGSVITGATGTTSIAATTSEVAVGADPGGATGNVDGTVFAVEVRNGIDGTLVADPDFAAQANGATGFTDPAGRVWTVNGTAEIVGGAETASITPDNGGIIVLKVIRHAFLNQQVIPTDFSDIEADGRGGLVEVEGRSVPVDQSDLMTSDGFTLELQTNSPIAERNLMLAIRAGEQLFLQTPPGCPVPGGYVRTEALRRSRRTRSARSDRRYFTLPCRVIAQPGPDIIGGTMTMRALADLYGSFDQLRAAHAEFAELVDLMADPDALVVL